MTKIYPLHPFADLFPAMGETEYAELREDIRQNGVREAIVLANNEFVLDGRHRLKACVELGLIPHYRNLAGDDDQLLAYVISTNLRRRHLDKAQREIIAAQIATLREGRPDKTSSIELVKSQRQAAAEMGVSVSGVKRARVVVEKGSPELVEAVKQGTIAVSAAAEIARVPAAEQVEIIARGKKEIKAAAKQIKEDERREKKAKRTNNLSLKAQTFTLETLDLPDAITIQNRDARDLAAHTEPNVGLAFMSPPYNVGIEYRSHNDNLSPYDYETLICAVFTQCYQVMVAGARIGVVVPFGIDRDPWKPVAAHFAEWLTDCGFTLFGQVVWDKGAEIAASRTSWGSHRQPTAPRFRDRTEAIVWAYKDEPKLEVPPELIFEDAKGSYSPLLEDSDYFATLTQDVWTVKPETRFVNVHPAPFPTELAERAIRLFGYPGIHVLDPFMGIGSTLVAAKKWGCRATGFEIDAGYCAVTQERLENEG